MTAESTSANTENGGKGDNLWKWVLVGLFAGLLAGILLGPDLNLVGREMAAQVSLWLALPGRLFLQLILFIVLPLVLSSVALSFTSQTEAKALKKLGGSIIVYFLSTKTMSVILAITITSLLAPGSFIDTSGITMPDDIAARVGGAFGATGSIPETIVALFPRNIFNSLVEESFLQVVIAAIIFGLALMAIPKAEAKPLVDLLNSVQSACIRIVVAIMRLAPLAVFGLLASALSSIGISAVIGIGAYVGTFLVVMLSIMTMYMTLVYVLGKRNPIEFLRAIREPMVLAFSTSSSSATMPITLRTAETKLGLPEQTRRLIIPLGTTVNMDGTAAYQGIVVIFLAQAFGIDLNLADIITLMALAIGASIGAAGIPGGSIAILTGILVSLGIPAEGIGIVLAMDRILDMIRTTNNVTGDLVATTVLTRLLGYDKKDGEGTPTHDPSPAE